MVEPVSITLAALALLDPAIRSVRTAYGVYRLTASFGEHYTSTQRKLDGEQARLETSLDTNLASIPDNKVLTQINDHLGHLEKHFRGCQDLIAKIEKHRGRSPSPPDLQPMWESSDDEQGRHSNGSAATPDLNSRNPGLTAVTAPERSKLKPKKLAKLFRKSDRSSSRNTSSATVTPETTPTSSLNIPDEAVQAATQQGHAAERLQSEATTWMKAKWVGGQRKEFEKHIEEIHASNDFIRDIVSMRTLGNIYSILVVPEFRGEIPEEVLIVQNSLHRLHHALNHSNQVPRETKPVVISIRVMEAAAYVRLRKKLTVLHDYIPFHENSALYPLQVQPSTATSSTVVLAETLMVEDKDFACPPTDNHLSEMLLGQSVDADEAFKEIGSVSKDPSSLDCHRLFQDISTSWTVQNTLADLIKSTSRFRTYMHLAVKVSISYMYLAFLGTPHQYPRLTEYRYYGLASEAKRVLDPDEVLEPYLSAGFGSRAPRRSTKDIGGTSSHSSGDEAMMGLGLVLHELGCWKTLDEQDPNRARDTAREKRKDLQASAGTTYAEIVDVCFAAKEVEWERHACAANIYRKVTRSHQEMQSTRICNFRARASTLYY